MPGYFLKTARKFEKQAQNG